MYAPENRAEPPPIYGILVGTMMNGHWVFMDFGASCFQSNTPQWLFLEINVGRYCVIMSWSFIHSSGIENTYMHTYVYVILYIIVSACMCVIHTSTQKNIAHKHEAFGPTSIWSGQVRQHLVDHDCSKRVRNDNWPTLKHQIYRNIHYQPSLHSDSKNTPWLIDYSIHVDSFFCQ
jgi:hypothetical protein